MIALDEAASAVRGTLKILRGDPQGIRYFDTSADGFLRSFAVILPLLVPSLLIIAAERQFLIYRDGVEAAAFPTMLFVLVQVLARIVVWFGNPLLVASVASPLGIAHRYSPLIVVNNWSSLVAVVPYTVSALLYTTGIASAQSFGLMNLIGFVFDVTLNFRVIRASTGAPINVTIGLLLMMLLFALLVGTVASGIVAR